MDHAFDPQVLLQLPLMANLATMSADGPRNAPVWFIWEGEAIWMLGDKDGSSVKRLKADPRCAVELVHFNCEKGHLLHLGMRGSATITPMDASLFESFSTNTSAQIVRNGTTGLSRKLPELTIHQAG